LDASIEAVDGGASDPTWHLLGSRILDGFPIMARKVYAAIKTTRT